MENKITFIDLETTGLDEQRNLITEVAAMVCTYKPGPNWRKTWKEGVLYEQRVFPSESPFIDPFVAKLNGYDRKEWLETGTNIGYALTQLYPMLEGSAIAGSNPSFDIKFLKAAMDKMGWTFPKLATHHALDVPSMGYDLVLKGAVTTARQGKMCDHFGIKGEAHRAGNDVKMCVKLFKKILESRSQ